MKYMKYVKYMCIHVYIIYSKIYNFNAHSNQSLYYIYMILFETLFWNQNKYGKKIHLVNYKQFKFVLDRTIMKIEYNFSITEIK